MSVDTLNQVDDVTRSYRAPIDREIESTRLEVSGHVPPALEGLYLRNGPNPRGVSRHWFQGDGMLHGVELSGGRARRYANRWVRTRTLESGARAIDAAGNVDLRNGASNTSVIRHAGRTLALVESSFPCEVTLQLETIGPYDFDGRLHTPMTAHPKRCPLTGELLFFGYSPAPSMPALTYHRVDPAGTLVESRNIDVPGRTLMHDFAITASHVVFLDLPLVFDLERARLGTMPFRWSDTYGARLGVMPRDGDATVRWFEIEPCYVFHVLNAFDDGGRVVLDAVRYRELWRDTADDFESTTLHRWTLDLDTGTVREETLDDANVEFPRVDDSRTGLAYRYGYAVGRSGSIVKYDLTAQRSSRLEFEPGEIPGEFTFVPAPGATAEDEGWILGFVYDARRDGSDFVIAEARDLTRVATVHLPQRVPAGFHGDWFPAPVSAATSARTPAHRPG
jgi:carotenoid cleavage dioxygenase